LKRQPVTLWKEAPFIRLIFPLITGILLQRAIQPGQTILFFIAAISVIALPGLSFLRIPQRYKFRLIYGLLIYLSLIAIGGLLAHVNDPFNRKDSIKKMYEADDILIVTVEEPLSQKKKSFKTIVTVNGLIRGNFLKRTTGKIVCYLQKDSQSSNLRYGSQLLLFGKLQQFLNSGNPGMMDYEQFATLQGYAYQAFLRKKDYVVLPKSTVKKWKKWLYGGREFICSIIRKYITGKKESGLAEALLIGYKEDLDKDLISAYSNTGVVHVIAISGLHLGILYLIFKWLLYPIRLLRTQKWISSILIIAMLWVFSLLTGGSPSVLRSAVMFTAIVGGESLAKKISIFNCLAASAFVLLCYKPYWLFDIGFQLSYTAVLSIVLFMKPIYNLLFLQNKILDHLWQLCAVTIAAQVLTTPVSIYYFHQFPVYFLIANIIAVPLSGLILIGEVILCALYVLPTLASFLGFLLSWMIRFMNNSIFLIDELPFSIIRDFNIDSIQLSMLYLAIAGTAGFLLYKKKAGLYFALLASIIILTQRCVLAYHRSNQQVFIVYNIKNSHLSEIINGKKAVIRSGIIPESLDLAETTLIASHRFYQVTQTKTENPGSTFFSLNKQKILFIDSINGYDFHMKYAADLVIITQNAGNMKEVIQECNPKMIVLDASNSFSTATAWNTACKKAAIKFHNVVDKGAFVMKFN